MKNLSIRGKLILTFGIVLVLYAGLFLFTFLLGPGTVSSGITVFRIVYFVLTAAVIAALCIYMIRTITRPLQEMNAAARLMAVGKLNADVLYSSKDEIGSLANSIRSLVANLRDYIADISQILSHISDGDMTATANLEYRNDFVPIKQSIEQIIASLNGALSQISISSQQVATGSEQISSGAQSLAQCTTEQAGSVQELARSVSEMAEKVRQTANDAQQANADMNEISSEIQQGGKQMSKLIGAMDEITDTSDKIQKISKTITDIAFQTNILSLNAEIEAARAGEAGRGFAVVADEIRNLAGKSAAAAKETTILIENTLTAINNGDKMVAEMEKDLNLIAQKANAASASVQEIADASKAQTGDIGNIHTDIDQISEVIQTNSATAEESAASSEELSAQAETLRHLISRFQLSRTA